MLTCTKCRTEIDADHLHDGEPCVSAFCNGLMHDANFSELEDILIDRYGVTLLEADAITIGWAADRIPHTELAKSQLSAANQHRHLHGKTLCYLPWGHRLFGK